MRLYSLEGVAVVRLLLGCGFCLFLSEIRPAASSAAAPRSLERTITSTIRTVQAPLDAAQNEPSQPESWIPVAWTARLDEEVRAEQRIRRALQKPIPIRCVDRPLSGALAVFAAQLGVPVSLDTSAFKEAGIEMDASITFSSPPGVSARSALGSMLDPLKLNWTYRREALLVTTNEAANTMVYTRVYPVADLVLRGSGGREPLSLSTSVSRFSPDSYSSVADFESLIELITSTVRPTSWDTVGGPGSIKGFEGSLVLVFSQTRDVHEEAESLLAVLRKGRAVQHVAQMEQIAMERQETQADEYPAAAYHPTVRQRATAGPIPAWQVPRTKDGRPFHVQTTPGPPNIGQGFGGGFGGGAAF